ncbi:Cytochrome P450 71D10 [Apostasia shenzhenica]|uniref:Cytochrome P450 71D10 n=1 Tax=Apostasia shenzhenica TaxID=1088818 RepID=A0A2I0B5A9_9ASPA|nr:Cytochrome P450 71D10 [Apostasia shenzhenica]
MARCHAGVRAPGNGCGDARALAPCVQVFVPTSASAGVHASVATARGPACRQPARRRLRSAATFALTLWAAKNLKRYKGQVQCSAAINSRMELFITATLIIAVLLLPFLKTLYRSPEEPRRHAGKQAPGPWGFPLIGNIHNILGPLPPQHYLRRLSSIYGPMHIPP